MSADYFRKQLKIRELVTREDKAKMIVLSQKYIIVFSWYYEDMLGVDMDIIVYRIPLVE